jgi:hypothetical protein
MGISFEEAKIEKKVIQFLKSPVKKQKSLLERYGYPHNNANVRRDSYRSYLTSNEYTKSQTKI